ncbi:MAG TPA: HAD-IIIA family hydrolase [Solirubrobacteraceae bacterium]|nr:HAD-IIIA family hydrolase [Solirubrobacteraceae bacterium]
MSVRPAVFLDRDGVLNEFVIDPRSGAARSPYAAEQVRLIPGAAAGAAQLAHAGYELVCITNQPAAAHGGVSVAQLLQVHRRVEQLLGAAGVTLAGSRVCWHHPEGVVPGLAVGCACRKPAPGMLLDAARALSLDLRCSWMVGDSDTDVAAGHAAGCRTVLIEYDHTAHKRSSGERPELRALDLADAVERLLACAGADALSEMRPDGLRSR